MCEICENSSLLTKRLNKLKRKFKERLPNNPHDLVEKFSCDSDKAVCMLEKSASCKSSSIIDHLVVEESLENEESKDSSEYDSSRDCEDGEFEVDSAEVVFYDWQTVDKKITKFKIEVAFKDAIEMLKEKVAILKEHIDIKRRQVNAYQEMASLSPMTLSSKLTLQRVTKMSNKMPFKVPILIIITSSFLQRVAILTSKEKSKTTTLLFSLKDQTMIEWLQ